MNGFLNMKNVSLTQEGDEIHFRGFGDAASILIRDVAFNNFNARILVFHIDSYGSEMQNGCCKFVYEKGERRSLVLDLNETHRRRAGDQLISSTTDGS